MQYKTVLPAYKMMSFHFLNYAQKNELALIQKVGTIRTGWARESQVHPHVIQHQCLKNDQPSNHYKMTGLNVRVFERT